MKLPIILTTHFRRNIEDVFIFLDELVKNNDLDAGLLVSQRTPDGIISPINIDITKLPTYNEYSRRIMFGLPFFIHFGANDRVYRLDRWHSWETEIIGPRHYTEIETDSLKIDKLKCEGIDGEFRRREDEFNYFDFCQPRQHIDNKEIVASLMMRYSAHGETKKKLLTKKRTSKEIKVTGEEDLLFRKVIEYAKS